MNAETTQLRLAGSPEDLFSHMVLWGVAAICADAGISGIRGRWSSDRTPVPVLHATASAEEIANAVQRHVLNRSVEGSWLKEEFELRDGRRSPSYVATMAPRTAAPASAAEWRRLDADTARVGADLPSALDEQLIAGLGYRSWWVMEGKGMRPDRGCSQWEMRTRNKGTDMVRDRLRPLAAEVSGWSPEKILAGLVGESTDDAVGKGSLDSRSATGFRLPGPVDNARAWCALWALSLLPVIPQLRGGGRDPAVAPRRSVAGSDLHHLLMVVPAEPMPLARFVRLQNSAQLVVAAQDSAEPDGTVPLDIAAQRRASQRWLAERGATRLLRFPVRYVGSASAPERQTLTGTAVY
jgi:CRISPR-associated protein Csb3